MTTTHTPAQRETKPNCGYFDFDDRLGVIGRGATVEEAFQAVAQAIFGVIQPSLPDRHADRTSSFWFEESSLESALLTWVNRALDTARTEHLTPVRFHLERSGSHWHAELTGWTEPTQLTAHQRPIRAADPTLVSVQQISGVWEARCVVDW